MKSLAELRQAWRSIARFRRRSLFMMLGVCVGITFLTVLNSVGENTKRETIQRVKNMLGTFDTLIIRPGGKSRGMVSLATVEPTLKFSDAEAIATELPEIKQVAQLQNAFDVDVAYRDRESTPAVFGVSSNWLDLRGDQVEKGAFFTAEDQRALARFAVLGSQAANDLFPEEEPLGKTIRIGGVPFVVRGILASRGAGPAGGNLDNLVLIPVSTASKRLFNRDFVTMLIAQLNDPNRSDAAMRDVSALLRQRHHLAAAALDDFNLTSPKAVMAQMISVASTLTRILTGVALLSMLTGGVVIMSLMLIGVSERRREIGLRRAVGASRRDILRQFLLEALLVSLAGGLAGMLLGLVSANAAAVYQKLPAIYSADALLLSFGLALLTGILFGIYPAWRASKVDPVQALQF